MNRIYKSLTIVLILLLGSLRALADDVTINVVPKAQFLPPQIGLYVNNPNDFFTVQLVNNTTQQQQVYLSLQLQHEYPNDGLVVATPEKYQPAKPFTVPANGTYSLGVADMKNLFNHIPASAMQIPAGLMDSYSNGSFGLLPEGRYSARFHAFRWTGNNEDTPYVVSNPMTGYCEFKVYYKASAPTWIQPFAGLGGDFDVAEVNKFTPIFTWSKPAMGAERSVSYDYTLKVVEIMNMGGAQQSPDEAMEHNAYVYQSPSPISGVETCQIPKNIIDQMSSEKTYVAQITAKQKTANSNMDYLMITNQGKSPLRVFRLTDDLDASKGEGDADGEKDSFWFGDVDVTSKIDSSVLYTFRNPSIINPFFADGEVRKLYVDCPINVEWARPWYVGGDGENPENLTMSYTVQLYNGKKNADKEAAMTDENLVYSKVTNELNDSIPWSDIEGKVGVNDYLVLRVLPQCLDEESVAFISDSLNVRDFTMRDHINPEYFMCSNMVAINNTNPTTKSGADYSGGKQEVSIGEYKLVIDKIDSGSGAAGFTGQGRVRWELGIGTAMVHVKFKNLKINTDDVVYEGVCETYENPNQMSNLDAVNGIFTDLGIEDLLASTGVPYAEQITEGGKQLLSDKLQGLSDYYSLVKGGMAIWDMLIGGKETDIYMPICMPKDNKALSSLNSSPVDIQVTTMKFAPTYATMDLIGEFTMPKSKCLASDILIFGAPRLCISPDHIIPEAGTLALLDKFTVTDPSTGYSCTFKAPEDLLEPSNGCYIAWKDYKFEVLGIDMDMEIPKMKKYDEKSKKVTDKLPVLNLRGTVASWDDFTIDNVSLDPFEVDALPGFTFFCKDISYDHSVLRNTNHLNSYKWPASFDKVAAIGEDIYKEHGLEGWQGLYVGKIGVQLPSGIISGEDRIEISAQQMLFDQSGVTLSAGFYAGDDGMKGSAGGFELALKEVALSFVQSNFNNCHMDGSLTVPMLKTTDDENAMIGFNCQIRKQIDESGKETDELAYIFNTRSLNGDYSLDLFLATLNLDDKLTYFLLEAEPDETKELKTKCELMLGGKLEIAGASAVEKFGKDKLGFDFSVPDIHFVGMRIANCEEWKSKYVDFQADIDKEREAQQKGALAGLYIGGKEFHTKDGNFYFHTGSWSLASMSKKLGPFEFSIGDFNIGTRKDEKDATVMLVDLSVTGKVALVKGIDLSASASVTLTGSVKNLTDISNISVGFEEITLDSIGVHTSFCGMTLDGGVEWKKDGTDPNVGKGFAAHLTIALPGNLFTVVGDGGYFKCEATDSEEEYSWGWVHVGLASSVGIQLGPCTINELGGGFYMNCSRNPGGDNLRPNNKAGLVGIYLKIGMATPDGEGIKGDLDLNVVYNRKRKCLSNFVMTGNVKAVGGMINSKMTLTYENSEMERFLQLNITVDAGLSMESLSDAVGEFGADLGSIQEQLNTLAGEPFEVLANVEAGLGDKVGAHADLDSDGVATEKSQLESPAAVKNNAKTADQREMAAKAGSATFALDMKITWRSGGKNYDKPKWHLYLGEPDENKRCAVTLIDFHQGPVDVKIGSNMYLCLGNELPNNGELPPIPAKIANFLDGTVQGEGVVSDNISTANSARENAMAGFKTDFGVMLGAQAYGHLGLNLGIIKGEMDALAGYDVSLVHYANGWCMNLGRKPGYKGWYGRGQLYAYLAMKLSAYFNLGFVDFDIPIVDGAVGGVLKLGGPNPTYFTGKVRAKLNLLGGLFKLDKKFEFDCGQYCQLFKGNALDNFQLFGDCTLGDTIRTNAWNVDARTVTADAVAPINRNISKPQYVDTEAPLDEHFRVLDENELERIANNKKFEEGSEEWEKLKMQACRTFVFSANSYARLYVYNSADDYDESKDYCGAAYFVKIPFKENSTGTRHYLDLAKLRSSLTAGKFYRLSVSGRANEVVKGELKDPYTCYDDGRPCEYAPWNRTINYYFRTEEEHVVDDKAPLQEYVAIAYPSNFNQLKSNESNRNEVTQLVEHQPAYLNDVKCPTIALTEDIRTKAFQKGKLFWRLLNAMGKQIDIAENRWVEHKVNGKVCGLNMEPSRPLNAQPNSKYILSLDYFTEGTYVDEESGDQVKELVDTTLVYLHVETLASDRNWRTGKDGNVSCDYDQPFIAQKMVEATTEKGYSGNPTDTQMRDNAYNMMTPMSFIGYMSNFCFPAGWKITERSFFGIEVTTSESMIFKDPNGGGKYEGAYQNSASSLTHDAFADVRDKFLYLVADNSNHPYPLSGYWQQSGKWDYVFDYDNRIFPMGHSLSSNTDTSAKAYSQPVFKGINKVYINCNRMSMEINLLAFEVDAAQELGDDLDSRKKCLKEWYANHLGAYLTESGTFAGSTDTGHSFYLPCYQFPTIWSMGAAELASGAYEGMSNKSERAKEAYTTWGHLTGKKRLKWIGVGIKYLEPVVRQYFDLDGARKLFSYARMVGYRVNTYNYEDACYDVSDKLQNGSGRLEYKLYQPLLSSSTAWIADEGGYNNSGKSLGSSTGNYVSGVSIATSADGAVYDELEKAANTIVTSHDIIEKCHDNAQKYWSYDISPWTTKCYANNLSYMPKHVKNAEQYARYAVIYKSKGNDYTANTEKNSTVSSCSRVTECWNDINEALKQSSPYEPILGYSESSIKILEKMGKALDDVLTPNSDVNSKEYKRYDKLYHESVDWVEEMKAWNDSIQRSVSVTAPYGEAGKLYLRSRAAYKYLERMSDSYMNRANNMRDSIQACQIRSKELMNLSKSVLNDKCVKMNSTSSSAYSNLPKSITGISGVNRNTAKKYVEKAQTVIDCASAGWNGRGQVALYAEQAREQMVKAAGEDGQGGLLLRIKELLNEDVKQYSNGEVFVTMMKGYHTDVFSVDSATARSYANKMEGRVAHAQRVMKEAQRRIDVLDGRSPVKADQADSLLIVAMEQLDSYRSRYGNKEGVSGYYKQLMEMYEVVNNLRKEYWRGDLTKIQTAIDKCDEFIKMYDNNDKNYIRYCADYDSLTHIADPAWSMFEEAGYKTSDVRYSDALKRWQDESVISTLLSWRNDVLSWQQELYAYRYGKEEMETVVEEQKSRLEAAESSVPEALGNKNGKTNTVSATQTSSGKSSVKALPTKRQNATGKSAVELINDGTITIRKASATTLVGKAAASLRGRVVGASSSASRLPNSTSTNLTSMSSSANAISDAGKSAVSSVAMQVEYERICVEDILAEAKELMGEDSVQLYLTFYSKIIQDNADVSKTNAETAEKASSEFNSKYSSFTATSKAFEAQATSWKSPNNDTAKSNVNKCANYMSQMQALLSVMQNDIETTENMFDANISYRDEAVELFKYVEKHAAPTSSEYKNGRANCTAMTNYCKTISQPLPSMKSRLQEADARMESVIAAVDTLRSALQEWIVQTHYNESQTPSLNHDPEQFGVRGVDVQETIRNQVDKGSVGLPTTGVGGKTTGVGGTITTVGGGKTSVGGSITNTVGGSRVTTAVSTVGSRNTTTTIANPTVNTNVGSRVQVKTSTVRNLSTTTSKATSKAAVKR